MKHRDKLKLARRHMTQYEIKKHFSPFQTEWWIKQRKKIADKLFIRERNQKSLALLKKQKRDEIKEREGVKINEIK